MIGIAAHAISDQFAVNLCAACLGVLVFFKDNDAGAFAHDESVTILVPRAAGRFRGIVARAQCAGGGKVAMPILQRVASLPPAIITSAMSNWIYLPASPMAFEPVAHAVATAVFGPVIPNWMETFPLAALTIRRGTVNGLTRLTPRAIKNVVLLFKRFQPANPAADDHAAAIGLFFGEIDPRVLHRGDRSSDAELAEAVEPLAGLLADINAVFGDVKTGALPAEVHGKLDWCPTA